MCGLPPFVDEMIDVFIDDDTVVVGVPRLFTRPLRLTAPEGFALVAAGRAAMQLPGADPEGPLGRGLQKLAAALGDDGVVVDIPVGPALEAVDRRRDRRRRRMPSGCDVEYWTPSRDEVTTRTITPRRVFNDRGEWYVVADDGRSGERRTFRIDRFESIEPTGEHDPCRRAIPMPRPVRPSGSPTAGCPGSCCGSTAAARWVVERYPVDDVTELDGGAVRATFPVASQRWLERLLVRLGPEAEVLEPAEWRDLGADVARRVLARYTSQP